MFDFMGLNENDLICIFMNINKDFEKNEVKRGKTMVVASFSMGYKIYHTSLISIFKAASVVRGTTLMT